MSRLARLLVLAVVPWLVSACHRQPSLDPQEQATVNALTANLTPRCVGRYLIDMPGDAIVRSSIEVQKVSMEGKAMSLDDYRKAMQARSDELKRTKSHYGYPFVYADTVIEWMPESRYFVSLGDASADPDSKRLIEAYRWDRGYQIKMQIQAHDAQHSEYFKDDPVARNATYMNDFKEKSRLLTSLLDRAHGRSDNEIPNQPGVCFPGGFLAGPQEEHEEVNIYFILPDHHDVSFGLVTDTDFHGTTTLLQRGGDIRAALAQDKHGKSLRHGKVALQGLDADEWLLQITTGFRIPGYRFTLEANSLPRPDNQPVVSLDLRVGSPSALTDGVYTIDKASLTEGESVALWDAVSPTLRPRPNAF